MIIKTHSVLRRPHREQECQRYSINLIVKPSKSEQKILKNLGISNQYGDIHIPRRLLFKLFTDKEADMEAFSPNGDLYPHDVTNDSAIRSFFDENNIEFSWDKKKAKKFTSIVSDYIRKSMKNMDSDKQEFWTTEYHPIISKEPDIPELSNFPKEPPIDLENPIHLRIGSRFYHLKEDKNKSRKYKKTISRVVRDIKDQGKIDRQNLKLLSESLASDYRNVTNDLRRRLKELREMPDITIEDIAETGVRLYANPNSKYIDYIFPFTVKTKYVLTPDNKIYTLNETIERRGNIDIQTHKDKIIKVTVLDENLIEPIETFHSYTDGKVCLGTMRASDTQFDSFSDLLEFIEKVYQMLKTINIKSWLIEFDHDEEMIELKKALDYPPEGIKRFSGRALEEGGYIDSADDYKTLKTWQSKGKKD